MNKVRTKLNIIYLFVSYNISTLMLIIGMVVALIIVMNMNIRGDIQYYVHSSDYIDNEYVYEIEPLTDYNSTIRDVYIFRTTKHINYDKNMGYNKGDIITINQMNVEYVCWVFIGIVFLVLCVFSITQSGWSMEVIKSMYYESIIEVHRDNGYIYYVIDDRIIYKTEEDLDDSYSIFNIRRYIEDRETLPIFKESVASIRDKVIKSIIG